MSGPIQNRQVGELPAARGDALRSASRQPVDDRFRELLDARLRLSGHAQTRLESRNIAMSADEWERVLDGVERAAQKGAREALVMVDQVALVVSIRNRTVITAVDKDHLKENVFTNIDSAVIV